MRSIRIISHISDHRTDQIVDQIQLLKGKFLKETFSELSNMTYRKLPQRVDTQVAEHSAMNIAVQSVQKEKRWKEEDHTESAKEE